MTYYFFNVDPLYKKICSNYDLFSFFKMIYLKNIDSIINELQYSMFTKRINQKLIHNNINDMFVNNKYHIHNNLYHNYYNKYRDERFSLKVCNNMLIYNANHINKLLIKSLSEYSFFVCNFKEQDYFWINEFSC